VVAADTDNTIEDNEILGNANGIFLTTGVQGNTIRGNTIVGNPPVQVAADHTSNGGFDIKNMAAAGANTFDNNVCLTGLNAPCPAASPDANSLLEGELQAAACGTYPPTPSCQWNISQWNWFLNQKVDPNAPLLLVGDPTQLLTVQQYLQARVAAGL
jgi:parallel beta-helix repeat protein